MPSPDGSLIAFRHSTGSGAVSVTDTSGEHARSLLTAQLNETFGKLDWSPDGKRVAIMVRRMGDTFSSIDAVDITDGKRTELTRQQHLRTFVWLPDGRLLFVTQDRSQAAGAVLHQLDAKGNERRLEIGSEITVAEMSTSADGKRLVLVRASVQLDVYVAEAKGKEAVAGLVRLTLNDRDDRPTGWQGDGQTVLFESNRNGTLAVFRQSLQSPAAELLVGGPDLQFGAQEAPDGKTILYWSRPEGSDRMRLMAIPIGGGPSTSLFEVPSDSQFHCRVLPRSDASCVVATVANGKVQVSEFSPQSGLQHALREIQLQGESSGGLPWALGSNAARIALLDGGMLRVIDARTGASWQISQSDLPGKVTGLSFLGESPDLIVTTGSARENLVLLVSRSGVRRLGSFPLPLSSPVPSPDGRRLLLGVATTNSNAWLLENF